MKELIRLIVGASILAASTFLFAFAFVHSAEAQDFHTMYLGDGWYRHSFSDGTVGYSMPMGYGWSRHSFSDGTTGYSMPLDEPRRGYGASAPGGSLYIPRIETPPLNLAPLNY